MRVSEEISCHMGGRAQAIAIQQDQVAARDRQLFADTNQPPQGVPAPEFRKSKTGFVFSHPV